MSNIIDGKLISTNVKEQVAKEVQNLKQKNINVSLAVIMVGDNAASQVYVNNKRKVCEELGILSKQFILSEDFGQTKLLKLIENLNNDPSVNGILCQLPLPRGYDEKLIIESINPMKDVDAFHPQNVGHIMIGDYTFLPCTPAGIMEMLNYYNIDITGKECVVVGRSNIVGKPMNMLLLHKNGTVTVAHSKTANLSEVTRRADILVAAVGKPRFITADMVKENAVVIDVGINRVEGKLCGDVDFDSVEKKASYITPVPGGVGPMTIAMLMQNTVTAAKLQNDLNSKNTLKI
jgi:methylenetetrahydrofolate dehydrogenase (NADP+)/methenyltetrahydrofolate cyclohydrolase